MRKDFEKGTFEQKAFAAFWELCQAFWIPEASDEYWEQYIAAANDFFNNYGSKNTLARACTKELTNYLERKYKEETKDEKS